MEKSPYLSNGLTDRRKFGLMMHFDHRLLEFQLLKTIWRTAGILKIN